MNEPYEAGQLAKDIRFELYVDGVLTEKALSLLIKRLTLNKETLAEHEISKNLIIKRRNK